MGYLLLLIIGLPIAEIYVFIKMGAHFGWGQTLLTLFLTSFMGASLAQHYGLSVLQRIQKELDNGKVPNAEMFDALMIFIGGVLLFVPGFITDVFGFLLLFPLTRFFIKLLLKRKLEKMMNNGQAVHVWNYRRENNQKSFKEEDVIDV